ncbi:hypothetical protein GGP85_002293 [Salinibacter ruber]|nr:hypothetical protein [Salinibacter ruber]
MQQDTPPRQDDSSSPNASGQLFYVDADVSRGWPEREPETLCKLGVTQKTASDRCTENEYTLKNKFGLEAEMEVVFEATGFITEVEKPLVKTTSDWSCEDLEGEPSTEWRICRPRQLARMAVLLALRIGTETAGHAGRSSRLCLRIIASDIHRQRPIGASPCSGLPSFHTGSQHVYAPSSGPPAARRRSVARTFSHRTSVAFRVQCASRFGPELPTRCFVSSTIVGFLLNRRLGLRRSPQAAFWAAQPASVPAQRPLPRRKRGLRGAAPP